MKGCKFFPLAIEDLIGLSLLAPDFVLCQKWRAGGGLHLLLPVI